MTARRKMSKNYTEWGKTFVTADGEYGEGVITFDGDDLTGKQFELLTEMHPTDRLGYALAILNGDGEETARIETEYGLDADGKQE
jgi:hypothetical protein